MALSEHTFGDSLLNPLPLWSQAPRSVIHDVLTDRWCELGPDFLCFENFYQSVATTWPHEYRVFDIGGYVGIQGWLFRHHAGYVDVNTPLNARRAELPAKFEHVVCDGREFIADYARENGFGEHDLFICSAVPNKEVQEAVKLAPNHVVWYPGEEMEVSGPFGRTTKQFFDTLQHSDWRKMADDAIFALLDAELQANVW